MTDLLTSTKPQKLKYVDKNHAYYLDGKRAKSVTTVAKVPEDGYALELWGKRMVAIGVASDDALRDAVAAHFDDRDKLNELVVEAETIARTHAAATRGTAMHRVAERADRGEAMLLTDLLANTVAAWRRALDTFEGGYDIVPEYIERAVVYPEQRICGRFDRFVRRRSDGLLRCLDLKSGDRALRYPHSIAVQLALYVNAPWMAGAWDGESGETTEFEPLPDDLDRETALVLHMPDPAHVSFGLVDVAAGWDIAHRACFPILGWRDRDDLVTVVELDVPSDDDSDPFDGVNGEARRTPTSSPVADPAPPTPQPPPGAPSLPRVEWIAARNAALPPEGLQLLTIQWPKSVRSPKAMRAVPHRDYDDDEVAAIEAVLVPIERQYEVPFGPADPCAPERDQGAASRDAAKIVGAGGYNGEASTGAASSPSPGDAAAPSPTPPASAPDEGDAVSDDDIATMARAHDELTGDARQQARAWLTEMAAAGSPLGLSRHRTVRRWTIAWAILVWAPYDDELLRAALAVVLGDEVQESITTGAALAALTIDEARRLGDMARALDAGSLRASYDGGVCALVAA